MKKLLIIVSLFFINGCSTYVEEVNNKQFKPLTPSFEEFNREEPSNGTIFSTSSAGLFSSRVESTLEPENLLLKGITLIRLQKPNDPSLA